MQMFTMVVMLPEQKWRAESTHPCDLRWMFLVGIYLCMPSRGSAGWLVLEHAMKAWLALQAPMLYCGEKIGTGQPPQVDVALDPLDGTTIISQASVSRLQDLPTSSTKSKTQ